jgi:hypothetical protein
MNSTIYMMLFSAAIVLTYLAVRLSWTKAYSAFIVGSMVTSMFFFLYSISRSNGLPHALTVGLGLGLIFTGLSVTLGTMFRSYAPVRGTVSTKVTEAIPAQESIKA